MNEIETNQDSVTQPIQVNQPNTPVVLGKNNNVYKYLFFAAVVLLLGVVVGFYFVLNNKINQLSNSQTVAVGSKTTQGMNISNEITPTNVPAVTSTESTLVSKDTNNNLYINNKFGFSLTIPKRAIGSVECKKEGDSYRVHDGKTSFTAFENNDIVYFAQDYFYRLIGEQKIYNSDGSGSYFTKFSACEKVKTTFDLIEKDAPEDKIAALKIYVTNIKDDKELESYFKSKYGLGCRLGKKTLSDDPGIYNVDILSDMSDKVDYLESKCPITGFNAAKYSPTKERLVIFEIGNACNINKETYVGCYDFEMLESIQFF